MRSKRVKKVVMCALFSAMICIATIVIQIPMPFAGYINMGDCVVLLAAFLLGPLYGAVAGGIGSALADVIVGYAQYMPATLIIKAVMALLAAVIYKKMKNKDIAAVAGGVVAETLMIAGYFGYTAVIMGNGISALATVPGNSIQAIAGICVAFILQKSILMKRKKFL